MFTMPTTSLALIRSNWYTFALLAILIFVLGSPLIMAQIQSTNLYSKVDRFIPHMVLDILLNLRLVLLNLMEYWASQALTRSGRSQQSCFWAQTYYTQGASRVGLQNSQLKNTSNTGESTLFDKGYLQLLFPLKSSELGLSVGLYPVTRSNLKIINEEQFLTYGDTVGYNSELQQIGGLNKFEIGFGWKISDQISIGYAPSVAFFSMQTSEAFFFQFLTIFATKAKINH